MPRISQIPAEVNITIPKGDDWPISQEWFNDDNSQMDLSLYTIFAKLQLATGEVPIPIVPINLSIGQFTLNLNSTLTSVMPIGNTGWYMVFTDPAGASETVLSGNIKIISR